MLRLTAACLLLLSACTGGSEGDLIPALAPEPDITEQQIDPLRLRYDGSGLQVTVAVRAETDITHLEAIGATDDGRERRFRPEPPPPPFSSAMTRCTFSCTAS